MLHTESKTIVPSRSYREFGNLDKTNNYSTHANLNAISHWILELQFFNTMNISKIPIFSKQRTTVLGFKMTGYKLQETDFEIPKI